MSCLHSIETHKNKCDRVKLSLITFQYCLRSQKIYENAIKIKRGDKFDGILR